MDLYKRNNVNWGDKLVQEKGERLLSVLTVENDEFSDIHRRILSRMETSWSLDNLQSDFKTIVKLINDREDFRTVFLNIVKKSFARKDDVSEETLEKISNNLGDIIRNCDRDVSKHILRKIESFIEIPFYRDELKNMLIINLSVES